MANDGKEQNNQVCIEVVNLNGKRLKFSVADSLTGHELQQMITNRLPRKEGAQVAIHHGSIPLSLKESLTQQGIGDSATLNYVYLPVDVHAAWCYMKGYSEDEFSLSGVTKIKVARPLVKPLELPESLQSLTINTHAQPLSEMDLPINLHVLRFGGYWNRECEPVHLPQRLQILTLSHGFSRNPRSNLVLGPAKDQQLNLPPNLKSLTFGGRCNHPVQDVKLPEGLQELRFGGFNQSIDGMIFPSRLQSLTLGPSFNQSLEKVLLPDTLKKITFGHFFNQSLEWVKLPSSLQELTFGYSFNQSLEGVVLPDTLEILTFGYFFNKSLGKVKLPDALSTLILGNNFNQSLEDVKLPARLQKLILGYCFRQSFNVKLPSSLLSLTFGPFLTPNLEAVKLNDLQSLTVGRNFETLDPILPTGLKCLILNGRFNQEMHMMNLPESLQTLTFGNAFNRSLDSLKWPETLQNLTFGNNFNQDMTDAQLPNGIKNLTFGFSFNQSLDLVNLPAGLQILTFGNNFNRSLEKVKLPSGLMTLFFAGDFNQNLDKVNLPKDLEVLVLGEHFNQSLKNVNFPDSLKKLTLNHGTCLEGATLPMNLEELCCDGLRIGRMDFPGREPSLAME